MAKIIGIWEYPNEACLSFLSVIITSSNGKFSALPGLCEGNPSVICGFPSQRPVTRSYDIFFDVHLNRQLSKQSKSRETSWHSLWRHCYGNFVGPRAPQRSEDVPVNLQAQNGPPSTTGQPVQSSVNSADNGLVPSYLEQTAPPSYGDYEDYSTPLPLDETPEPSSIYVPPEDDNPVPEVMCVCDIFVIPLPTEITYG